MDSAYLLIIDNSPDLAQMTNSFLRNAGMAIRVVSATNINELEDALQEKSPFLVLLGTNLPASIKIGQVLQTADQLGSDPLTAVFPQNLQQRDVGGQHTIGDRTDKTDDLPRIGVCGQHHAVAAFENIEVCLR